MLAIKVIWKNGSEDYLMASGDTEGHRVAALTKSQAREQKDFMLMGMADEVQSINIVPYPGKERTKK